MNSGESTAGSGFGNVPNQPSPIEPSQSQISAKNLNLGSSDHPIEALFEAAIDAISHVNASIASFRVSANREWEYTYLSAGTKAIFGYTAEEFLAEKSLWLAQVYPEDQEALRACFENALAESPTTVEYRYYRKDGSLRWISDTFTSRRLENANGWIVTVVGTDITDQKQTEATLRENKERYMLATQAGQVGVWDWQIQTDDVLIDPQLKTMLGFEAEELLDEIEVWRGLVYPEDLERVTAAMSSYLAGEVPEYVVEHRMQHKDGSVRWFLTRGVAFWTPEGQPYRMLGTRTDITERKRLDLALQASEASLNNILDNTIAAIASFRVFADHRWENDYFSAGFEVIFGYTPQELMAEKFLWRSRVLPQDWDTVIKPLFDEFFAERPVKAEYRFFHKDGSLRWISTHFTSQRNQAADCWIIAAVSADISDRKRAEEAIRQQAVWEQLLRTIAQRIRQSLNVEQVLSTAVAEIQQVLQADRTLIFRLNPDGSGQVIKEAVVPEYPITDQMLWLDECFPPECYEHYRQGQPRIVPDVATDEWADCLVEFMQGVGVRSKVVAPITHHPENAAVEVWGLLIVHACSYQRRWQPAEAEFLQQISNQLAIAIQQAALYQQLQTELAERKQAELAIQQAMEREQQVRERERFIATIAQNIRQSLDINQILTTTVEEVRRFLEVDRVVIYGFNPDWSGQIVAESLIHESYSIIQERIDDPCFRESLHHSYQQGRIYAVNDIRATDLQPCYVELLTRLQIRAILVVPILVQQDLWGLLVAHQCTAPREWQQISWYLLRQLSTQLAIGIYQAELYQQVQQLNSNLESQVQERTAELRRSLEFEALLKRITDNVRDSLDEDQILQTAVRELATGLEVECCNTDMYDLKQETCTIRNEYTITLPSSLGQIIPISALPEVFGQLLQGHYLQFCLTIPNPARLGCQPTAILACPIFDNQGVLGDLWLFRKTDAVFSEREIRLVQQVANQCAIAIRQARLYEAAQSQVSELERLNQLKDDFLSTVSHELRTPVSSIKMATQMLEIILFGREQSRQEEESSIPSLTLDASALQRLRRYFKVLQEESQREINLINNLLDLTRLDAETDPLFTNTINLQVWLPHVVEPFMERIASHSQQLQFDLAADLPALSTDLSYLQRILSELLTNACKYTPSGGTIVVSAHVIRENQGDFFRPSPSSPPSSSSPTLLISVTNTGVEIPPHELSRIFDKFYRIPNNDPWKHGGTGLGLALVQKLANRLGATIHVESTGGQTTLKLYFPIA
ncbi:MAG: PAS domain-containing protein [Kovacikia sp.]